MKPSLLYILPLALLFACGTDTKPVQQSAAPEISFKTLNTPVPFAGNWISADYLQNLLDHQSPRKAQEGSEDCFIQLPGSTLQPATMVINFHEGLSDLVTVKHNDAYQLWEKQNDTLSRALYVLEPISADTLKIGGKSFVKIQPVTKGQEPLILEEILFKGVYTSKNGERVEFKNNGEISGLGQYKYYRPVIDYYDAGLQIDQVGLGETMDAVEYFGFKFKKNKLELYKIKCVTYDDTDKRCVEVAFGQKAYDLEKASTE
jgi:hypothetical protein